MRYYTRDIISVVFTRYLSTIVELGWAIGTSRDTNIIYKCRDESSAVETKTKFYFCILIYTHRVKRIVLQIERVRLRS